MAQHGTRAQYKRCRDSPNGGPCGPCRSANNAYERERKQKRLASVPTPAAPTIGPVEQGVIDLLARFPDAVDRRPDLAASARAMARIQDSPAGAQAPNAARQMHLTLAELLKGTQRHHKLASIRRMTRHP